MEGNLKCPKVLKKISVVWGIITIFSNVKKVKINLKDIIRLYNIKDFIKLFKCRFICMKHMDIGYIGFEVFVRGIKSQNKNSKLTYICRMEWNEEKTTKNWKKYIDFTSLSATLLIQSSKASTVVHNTNTYVYVSRKHLRKSLLCIVS